MALPDNMDVRPEPTDPHERLALEKAKLGIAPSVAEKKGFTPLQELRRKKREELGITIDNVQTQ